MSTIKESRHSKIVLTSAMGTSLAACPWPTLGCPSPSAAEEWRRPRQNRERVQSVAIRRMIVFIELLIFVGVVLSLCPLLSCSFDFYLERRPLGAEGPRSGGRRRRPDAVLHSSGGDHA